MSPSVRLRAAGAVAAVAALAAAPALARAVIAGRGGRGAARRHRRTRAAGRGRPGRDGLGGGHVTHGRRGARHALRDPVWGLGLLAWLAVGGVVLCRRPAPVPVLRSASAGATGLALPRSRAGLVALAVPLGALALLPALSGHAGTEQPAWLWLPGNIVHVVAASAWIGGLVALVVALRAATRTLEPADRTRLLAAVVGRFSTLAGIAVAALLVTGGGSPSTCGSRTSTSTAPSFAVPVR